MWEFLPDAFQPLCYLIIGNNGRFRSGKSYGPVFGIADVNKVPAGINGILPGYVFRYLHIILLRLAVGETGEDTYIFHSANIKQSRCFQ